MHPAIVQGIGALRNLEEAGALLEALRTHSRHLHQILAARDLAGGLAVGHDLFRERPVDSRHVLKQREARGIQVHADIVDDRADDLVEHFREFFLVHVVLIEAYSDRLRIDFDELRQGILEAAADGNSSADGQIELREFLARDVARRIHRSSVLVHDGIQNRGAVLVDHLGHDLLHLPGSGAVSDRDQLDIELLDRAENRRLGLGGLMLVNHEIAQILAGGIEGGALGAGPDSRVHAENAGSLDRLLHEQVLQVLAEHADSVIVRLLRKIRANFAHDGGRQDADESVGDRFLMVPVVYRVFFFDNLDSRIHVHVDLHIERLVPLSAVDREHAVRLDLVERLLIIPIHLIDAGLLGVFVAHAGYHELAALHVPGAHVGAVFRVLRHAFGDDVHRPVDRLFRGTHGQFGVLFVGLHIRLGGGFHRGSVLFFHKVGQRLQASLDREHSAGFLLLFEGRPEVFKLREGGSLHHVVVQQVGQLSLAENAFHDLDAPGFKILIALEQVIAIPNLDLVQRTVPLLAVAGNKGDCASFGDERNDCGNLRGLNLQLFGDPLQKGNLVHDEGVNLFLGKFHNPE